MNNAGRRLRGVVNPRRKENRRYGLQPGRHVRTIYPSCKLFSAISGATLLALSEGMEPVRRQITTAK